MNEEHAGQGFLSSCFPVILNAVKDLKKLSVVFNLGMCAEIPVLARVDNCSCASLLGHHYFQ
jgi:hypothetical protein